MNPYVHPDESKHMLNRIGNDGYSFDEKDDAYDDDIIEGEDMFVPKSIDRVFPLSDDCDLPEILDKLEQNKANPMYAFDAVSMYNLAYDISRFSTVDWSGSHGMKDKISNSFAEILANVDRYKFPDKYDYLVEASELGSGELFTRDVANYRRALLDGKADIYASAFYDASRALVDDTNKDSFIDNENDVLAYENALIDMEQMQQSEDYQQETRQAILERENIDANIPDRELPWYVAKEMQNAGVDLDIDGPLMD